MFPFCVAGGGFAMDPGVAMRRAAMMDDDMDSAGVEDKDADRKCESTKAISPAKPTRGGHYQKKSQNVPSPPRPSRIKNFFRPPQHFHLGQEGFQLAIFTTWAGFQHVSHSTWRIRTSFALSVASSYCWTGLFDSNRVHFHGPLRRSRSLAQSLRHGEDCQLRIRQVIFY